MANIEKPIWSADGQTLTNVLVNNKNTTYNKVSNWYDGTPMDDSKLDDDFVYVKYEGEYLVRNMEEGQVLQKDTMDDMRNLSTFETLLLKMGVYKHVQLNGYYEKGDTPEPINYIISDTVEDDDGAGVVETINSVKLIHDFSIHEYIDSSYLGIDNTGNQDVSEKIEKYILLSNIKLKKGIYLGKLDLVKNKLFGENGAHIKYNGESDGIFVRLYEGSSLDNIIIDGSEKAARGVVISDGGDYEYSVTKCEIKNLYGEEQQSNGIYSVSNDFYKKLTIKNCVFKNIHAEEDGIEGNSKGASRAILVSGEKGDTTIDRCYFYDIGTFEDGDSIAIHSTQDPSKGWTDLNVIVDNCYFYDIRKRALKVQASGVIVKNCVIRSSYIDEDECPSEAIGLYGSNNIVNNVNIVLQRSIYGIRVSGGNFNQITDNFIIVDPDQEFPSARGNNLTASVSDEGEYTNISSNSKLSANTISIRSLGAYWGDVSNNNIEGEVRVSANSQGINIENNKIIRKESKTGFSYGIYIEGYNSIKDTIIKNNIILKHSYGIRLGSTSNNESDKITISGNKGVSLVNGMFSKFIISKINNQIGGVSLNTGISEGNLYDSSSGKDFNDLTPEETAFMNSSLPNAPQTQLLGSRWWKTQTFEVFQTTNSSYCLVQVAESVGGEQVESFGSIILRRYFDGDVWTDWVRDIKSYDLETSSEITTGIGLRAFQNRIIDVTTDKEVTISQTVDGKIVYIMAYNNSSSDKVLTFNGLISDSFTISPEETEILILSYMKGKGVIKQI